MYCKETWTAASRRAVKGLLRHRDRPSIDFTSSFYTSLWSSIKTVYLVLFQLLSLKTCFVLFQLECSLILVLLWGFWLGWKSYCSYPADCGLLSFYVSQSLIFAYFEVLVLRMQIIPTPKLNLNCCNNAGKAVMNKACILLGFSMHGLWICFTNIEEKYFN